MDDEKTTMYEYLTELRDSGEMNMWGAAKELEREFGLHRYKAKDVLLAWMEWCRQTAKEN